MPQSTLEVRHLDYLTCRRSRRELQVRLRKLYARHGPGCQLWVQHWPADPDLNAEVREAARQAGMPLLTVHHEPGRRLCCEVLEDWTVTLRRLIGALESDGLRAAGVVLTR